MKQFGQTIYHLVKDLEDSRAKLQWQSEHDSLTQLANRYLLETELFPILGNSQYRSVVLCLADIDHFKTFNDNYGHIEGDNALIEVSSCLKALSFPAAEQTVVARFGGEEFCIVVASQDRLDKDVIGNIITDSIAALNIEHKHSLTCPYLTLSVGGVFIDQLNSDDYLKYFQQADKNLYQAKSEGRNRAITSNFS